jgi:hypothetical protein
VSIQHISFPFSSPVSLPSLSSFFFIDGEKFNVEECSFSIDDSSSYDSSFSFSFSFFFLF